VPALGRRISLHVLCLEGSLPTIIFVHGTFAAGPERGDQWWQLGSPFETQLRESVAARKGSLTFQRLHWDGRNTENSRRKSAAALLERCQQLESRGEHYVLIGHSHGGSIISNALLLACQSKQPLPNMRKAITVGTPFLHLSGTSALAQIWLPILIIILFLGFIGGLTISATTPGAFLNRQLISLDAGFRNVDPVPPILGCGAHAEAFSKAIGGLGDREQTPQDSEARKKLCDEQARADDAARSHAKFKSRSMSIIFSTYLLAVAFGVWFAGKLFVEERAKADRTITPANIRLAGELFESRWLGFAHTLDEAVGGLSRATSLRPASSFLIPRILTRTSDLFSVLSAVLFVFLGVIWMVLFSAASQVQPAFSSEYLIALGSAAINSPERAAKIGLAIAIIFAAGILALRGLRRLMRASFAWAGNQVDQRIQGLLLGLDRPGQKITAISSRPMWSRHAPLPMPDDVTTQLSVFDDSQSLVVVHSLRRELYAAMDASNTAVVPNFSDAIAAFELTHTSYFNSSLFRKLIFVALTEQSDFEATSVLSNDTEFDRLREWVKSSRGPQASVATDRAAGIATGDPHSA
jgi:hypothetical protein